MIRDYLNQIANWEQMTGSNAYGEPEYADPVIIKVRKEGNRRLVRNDQGEEVVSETTVYCVESVNTGDKIDGQRVITVSTIPDIDGKASHREVAL